MDKQALAQGADTLLDADGAALDHDPVLRHDTIVGEPAHGRDCLFRYVKAGGPARRDLLLCSHAIDLLVELGSVVISVLTGTRDRVHDTAWMPGTDTGNLNVVRRARARTHLSQTLVCLSGELLGSPSGGNTLESVTLCDSNGVNHFILFKDRVDSDLLFKVVAGPVDLFLDRAAVQLDLHHMCLQDVSLYNICVGYEKE